MTFPRGLFRIGVLLVLFSRATAATAQPPPTPTPSEGDLGVELLKLFMSARPGLETFPLTPGEKREITFATPHRHGLKIDWVVGWVSPAGSEVKVTVTGPTGQVLGQERGTGLTTGALRVRTTLKRDDTNARIRVRIENVGRSPIASVKLEPKMRV